MDANLQPSTYPINAVLSTAHNGTYISTSSNGAQDQPCPDSYTYNLNSTDPDEQFSDDCCTFNASYTCHGYYDLDTSTPIYFETSTNFTGGPEDATTTIELEATSGKTYYSTPNTNRSGTTVGHYGIGNQIFGFVDTHEEQVLVLGLNSTFLNALYAAQVIASRSIGLYYGVPASAGADLERNGSMVMGGYSSSHIQGNLSTQTYPIGAWKLPRQCPWEIDISSIYLDSETSSTPFTACIEPSSTSLVLPASIYSQLSSTSNTFDLIITLSNSLTATIPSSLVSILPTTDSDPSPILGAPFLSQFYIYADYQTKTLAVGLANNTKNMVGPDQLMCVEHASEVGDLGWVVGNPNATATGTSTVPGATKSSGADRLKGGVSMRGLAAVGFGVWLGWR